MADIDEMDFYPHVEALGYDAAWVTDCQMLARILLSHLKSVEPVAPAAAAAE